MTASSSSRPEVFNRILHIRNIGLLFYRNTSRIMIKAPKEIFQYVISVVILIALAPVILAGVEYLISWIYDLSLTLTSKLLLGILLFLIVLGSFILWKSPSLRTRKLKSLAGRDELSEYARVKDEMRLEDDLRKTILQIAGGCFVLIGFYASYITHEQTNRSANVELISKGLLELTNEATFDDGRFLLERTVTTSVDENERCIKSLTSWLKNFTPKGKPRVSEDRISEIISLIQLFGPRTKETIKLNNLNLSNLQIQLDSLSPLNIDLSDTDLSNSFLVQVDLSKAILKNTNFNGVDLSRVRLPEKLENLSGANLQRVRLYSFEKKVGETLASDVCRNDGYEVAYNCDIKIFTGGNLSKADLSGNSTLGNSQLSNVNLSDARLINTNLSGARFNATDLTRANMSGAILRGVDLTVAIVADTILTKANLTEANVSHINFAGDDLDGTIFTRANLSGTTLTDTSFKDTILFGANLSNAKGLQMQQLQNALIDEKTTLPEEFEDKKEFLLKNTQIYLKRLEETDPIKHKFIMSFK